MVEQGAGLPGPPKVSHPPVSGPLCHLMAQFRDFYGGFIMQARSVINSVASFSASAGLLPGQRQRFSSLPVSVLGLQELARPCPAYVGAWI